MGLEGVWAKLNSAGEELPLLDHSGDVAAVFECLVTTTAWRARLEETAGRVLGEVDLARLTALAFLHDLGKCNAGFQARRDPGAPPVGHCPPAAPIFCEEAGREAAAEMLAELTRWEAFEHVPAMLAHHGRPLKGLHIARDGLGEPLSVDNASERLKHVRHWTPPALAALAELFEEAARRYPRAFRSGPSLPDAPAFVALFAGLLTLADWIGSDSHRFPVSGPHGEVRRAFTAAAAAEALEALDLSRFTAPALPDFEAAFGFPPHPAQIDAAAVDLGPVAVLEAETGSGKTEAALWRFATLAARGEVDGLYFAAPTRTAATQLHARVNAALARLYGADAPRAVLAVPGYIRAGEADAERLPGFEVLWPDEDRLGGGGRWAAEVPRRYLAARVAVGTVDQALLAGLQVRHAHLRAAALSRALLVVDEVHASDAYMTEILQQVLTNHVRAGGRALLLSATLGGAARARLTGAAKPSLEAAERVAYPAVSGAAADPRPTLGGEAKAPVGVTLAPEIADPAAIAARAAAAAERGAAVLVLRNTVDGAVAVQRALEARLLADSPLLFRAGGAATLHHGRFAPADRMLLDREVEAVFGKRDPETGAGMARRPGVLCGTQTLEQSLDIDADLLIADLAPMDVLLQRLGRLHRHRGRARPEGFERPQAVILMPAERDLRPLSTRPRHGLGPRDDGTGVYPDLGVIEASWTLLEAVREGSGVIAVPDDCRRLVERATHPEAVEAAAARAGIDRACVTGAAGMERLTARELRLDAGRPFTAFLFPEEGRIGTRLGAQDRRLALPPGAIGPFGLEIEAVTVPHWMAKGLGEAEEARAQSEGEALRLEAGEAAFLYDRFGLARVKRMTF